MHLCQLSRINCKSPGYIYWISRSPIKITRSPIKYESICTFSNKNTFSDIFWSIVVILGGKVWIFEALLRFSWQISNLHVIENNFFRVKKVEFGWHLCTCTFISAQHMHTGVPYQKASDTFFFYVQCLIGFKWYFKVDWY